MITESSSVKVRLDKPSATIILNRPEKKNAINDSVIKKLKEAFDDLHQEKGVRAVILTGAGDTFSSGTDLQELQDKSSEENAMHAWHDDALVMSELIEQMLRFPKPIIAAVNGCAMGVAATLVLASDIVIASEDAQLGFPESRRGLVPGHAAPMLAFRVGTSMASRLMLSGKAMNAEEAKQMGLFHEVVDSQMVWVKANQCAKDFEETSPQSIQLIKKMLNETIGETMLTNLSICGGDTATARTTESAEEGIAAFLEKRPPHWP